MSSMFNVNFFHFFYLITCASQKVEKFLYNLLMLEVILSLMIRGATGGSSNYPKN